MKLKKQKILFKKKYISVGYGAWKSIRDDEIIKVLMDLKREFKFQILEYHICDCFCDSCIIIKCKKEDWPYIYAKFFRLLRGYIENANFKI